MQPVRTAFNIHQNLLLTNLALLSAVDPNKARRRDRNPQKNLQRRSPHLSAHTRARITSVALAASFSWQPGIVSSICEVTGTDNQLFSCPLLPTGRS